MNAKLFRMVCISNLHVGNGDVNYTIINNEVQKDPVFTDVPTIQASSLKGALKEHFEGVWGSDKLNKVFGSAEDAGQYKFFSAQLVARPLRVSDADDGAKPYVLATSTDILENFSAFLSDLGLSDYFTYRPISSEKFDSAVFLTSDRNVRTIEGETAQPLDAAAGLDKLIPKPYAVARHLPLLDYPLPVISRNVLNENGISNNVWYEEVVPHKSVFYFAVLTPNEECLLDFKSCVQIGANASVGYGYTRIEEVV